MTALLTLREVAPLLACRDTRTVRRRLATLGVPVLDLGGRLLVDRDDLDRAIRAAARPLQADAAPRAGGVTLAPGARLWDGRQ